MTGGGIPLPLTAAASSQTLSGAGAGALVRRSVLPGGIRVLTEAVPHLRSVTLGAWVGVGSRDEADGHHGSTHFLEHLLFKGTARRSAMDIAEAFDAVGGESNAATGKEQTTYYARVLDADLPLAVDVLTDMVTSARLRREDVDAERGVILEELAMNDDDPTDVAHERFAECVFGPDTPLGRPIGGTPESIRAVPREAVAEHYRRHYRAPGLVVTAAGGLDHDEVCALVARAVATGGWDAADGDGASGGAGGGGRDGAADSPLPRRGGEPTPPPPGRVLTVERGTEQANVLLGGAGLTATDPRRHTLSVLNAVLGGGMSSRLFQEVREKRGLAYSVYSFASGYADAGQFGLYAGCAPAAVPTVVELLAEQWEALAATGPTPTEMTRAIGQVRGGTVLAMEDTGARMNRLGRCELVHGEYLELTEILDRTAAVTADDVQALAAHLWAQPHSLTVVGPFDADPVDAAP